MEITKCPARLVPGSQPPMAPLGRPRRLVKWYFARLVRGWQLPLLSRSRNCYVYPNYNSIHVGSTPGMLYIEGEWMCGSRAGKTEQCIWVTTLVGGKGQRGSLKLCIIYLFRIIHLRNKENRDTCFLFFVSCFCFLFLLFLFFVFLLFLFFYFFIFCFLFFVLKVRCFWRVRYLTEWNLFTKWNIFSFQQSHWLSWSWCGIGARHRSTRFIVPSHTFHRDLAYTATISQFPFPCGPRDSKLWGWILYRLSVYRHGPPTEPWQSSRCSSGWETLEKRIPRTAVSEKCLAIIVLDRLQYRHY